MSANGLQVILLGGLDPMITDMVDAGLLLQTDDVASVALEPQTSESGARVALAISDGTGLDLHRSVDLINDCLGCTLRQAMLEGLRTVGEHGSYEWVILRAAPTIELDAATELAEAVTTQTGCRLQTVVAVLGAQDWWRDLTGSDVVADRGIAVSPDDDRVISLVQSAQLDVADLVLVCGDGDAPEQRAALPVLAPQARIVHMGTPMDVGCTQVLDPHAASRAVTRPPGGGILATALGRPGSGPEAAAALGELDLVRWHHPRPVHPSRLYDRLEQLADGVVRSAGILRLAGNGAPFRWDTAGSAMTLGPVAVDDDDHHGRPGDAADSRASGTGFSCQLALLGYQLQDREVGALLDECTLTDAEWRAGPELWRTWPNPFDDGSDDAGRDGAGLDGASSDDTGPDDAGLDGAGPDDDRPGDA